MRRAHASQASRSDFAALRHKLRQQTHIFIVDRLDLLDAELANFLAPEEFAAAAFAGTAWASCGTWTARSATLGTVTAGTFRPAFAVTRCGCCFRFFCHGATPAF